jgi:hypothetical protein
VEGLVNPHYLHDEQSFARICAAAGVERFAITERTWGGRQRLVLRIEAAAGVAPAAVLGEAVRAYEAALAGRLVAGYALGSLAHGGFSPLVSDVDLGLVLVDPLLAADGDTIERVARELSTAAPQRYGRLSVFWGTRETLSGRAGGGRFPPLDRLDLLQHGRLLTGEDARAGVPEPSGGELLAAGAEFALDLLAGDEVVALLRQPTLLLGEGVRRVTKVVLFPVRFLYTAETGLVGANEAAATRYVQTGRPGADLVAAALRWRTNVPADDEALPVLEHELIPLYRAFIDDHRARLAAIGRHDLAAAFGAWRSRLDA